VRNKKLLLAVIGGVYCAGALAATNDPMRPVPRPGTVKVAPKAKTRQAPRRNWVLSSTLVGDARRVAVINDHLVSVGDAVFGATVIEIGKRSARLRYAGRDVLLELGESQIAHQSEAGTRPGAGK
jgi:sRNA-binding protein